MIRKFLLSAILFAFSGTAFAADFRIGMERVDSIYHPGTSLYFDTFPGQFCGTKAFKIEVLGTPNAFNRTERIHISRIYFEFEKHTPQGPFASYVRVNLALTPGQSSSWIQAPTYEGSCLRRVRVYAQGELTNPFTQEESLPVVVEGTN